MIGPVYAEEKAPLCGNDDQEALSALYEVFNREHHGVAFSLDDAWYETADGFGMEVQYRHGWNASGKFRLQGRRWDLYVIDHPAGTSIPTHVDPVPGRQHWRANLRLWGEDAFAGEAVLRIGPLVVFPTRRDAARRLDGAWSSGPDLVRGRDLSSTGPPRAPPPKARMVRVPAVTVPQRARRGSAGSRPSHRTRRPDNRVRAPWPHLGSPRV
jgi:hypothetical protein